MVVVPADFAVSEPFSEMVATELLLEEKVQIPLGMQETLYEELCPFSTVEEPAIVAS